MLTVPQTKFLDNLRSGNFEQVTGALKGQRYVDSVSTEKVTGYCCLGVACETYRESHPSEVYWDADNHFRFVEHGVYGTAFGSVLPARVRDWLGLPTDDPIIVRDYEDEDEEDLEGAHRDTYLTAVQTNDDKHWNFSQIADAFQAEFERINASK